MKFNILPCLATYIHTSSGFVAEINLALASHALGYPFSQYNFSNSELSV